MRTRKDVEEIFTPFAAHEYLRTRTRDIDHALDFLVAWESGAILSDPAWKDYRVFATGNEDIDDCC